MNPVSPESIDLELDEEEEEEEAWLLFLFSAIALTVAAAAAAEATEAEETEATEAADEELAQSASAWDCEATDLTYSAEAQETEATLANEAEYSAEATLAKLAPAAAAATDIAEIPAKAAALLAWDLSWSKFGATVAVGAISTIFNKVGAAVAWGPTTDAAATGNADVAAAKIIAGAEGEAAATVEEFVGEATETEATIEILFNKKKNIEVGQPKKNYSKLIYCTKTYQV